MTHSYQTFNNLVNSSDEIAQLKKIAKMKASGTYCDTTFPDRSFTNFKTTTCKTCPNYNECEKKSEKESMNVLKYRRQNLKKPKSKRPVKTKKGCGCK
jgi:hypothetical protein